MQATCVGKFVWWLFVPVDTEWRNLRRDMYKPETREKIKAFEELRKKLMKTDGETSEVTISGKLTGWLAPVVWRHMQDCQHIAKQCEEEMGYWANDEWLWQDFLDDLLKCSNMTMRDLHWEYGDLDGNQLPSNPVVSDEEALERIHAYWSTFKEPMSEEVRAAHYRNMMPSEITDKTGLNYGQVKRLVNDHLQKAIQQARNS